MKFRQLNTLYYAIVLMCSTIVTHHAFAVDLRPSFEQRLIKQAVDAFRSRQKGQKTSPGLLNTVAGRLGMIIAAKYPAEFLLGHQELDALVSCGGEDTKFAIIPGSRQSLIVHLTYGKDAANSITTPPIAIDGRQGTIEIIASLFWSSDAWIRQVDRQNQETEATVYLEAAVTEKSTMRNGQLISFFSFAMREDSGGKFKWVRQHEAFRFVARRGGESLKKNAPGQNKGVRNQ